MKLLRPYPPLLLLLCAGLMVALRFLVPGPRLLDPELKGLGRAIMLFGAFGAGIGAARLRRGRTPILPFKTPATLITSGPYAISRNPIYLCLALVLVGWAVWLRSATPPLGIPLFIWMMTAWVIRPEEKRLEAHFGEPYRAYCRRVRRWI